jgi:hypothetical protein
MKRYCWLWLRVVGLYQSNVDVCYSTLVVLMINTKLLFVVGCGLSDVRCIDD